MGATDGVTDPVKIVSVDHNALKSAITQHGVEY